MAGIGFEMRRVVQGETTLLAKARVHAAAALLVAGPWILTVVTLLAFIGFGRGLLAPDAWSLFRAVVTYAFGFSLVAVGIVQMAFTRRIADLLWTGRSSELLPVFGGACRAVAGPLALVAAGYCTWHGIPLTVAAVGTALFVLLGLTWLALVWLGATRDWVSILWAYGLGALVTVGAVLLLRVTAPTFAHGDPAGLLAAYTLGQGCVLAWLLRALVRGLIPGGAPDVSIVGSLRTYPRLVGVGLFYSVALWIDHIVMWLHRGERIHAGLWVHGPYDTARFLAYLTILPALVVHLVHVETRFHERYRRYYGSLLSGFALGEIHARRHRMDLDLRAGTLRVLRVQGALTVLALVLAEAVVGGLAPGDTTPALFRACALGAFFHVLLLNTLLILLYLDLRSDALLVTFLFFAGNVLFTHAALDLGPGYTGFGYVLSSLLSLAAAGTLLSRRIPDLERRAFATAMRARPVPSSSE